MTLTTLALMRVEVKPLRPDFTAPRSVDRRRSSLRLPSAPSDARFGAVKALARLRGRPAEAIGALQPGVEPDSALAVSSAARKTLCEVAPHAAGAGASRKGIAGFRARGGRSYEFPLDREPGHTAGAPGRSGPRRCDGGVREAEDGAKRVVDHSLRAGPLAVGRPRATSADAARSQWRRGRVLRMTAWIGFDLPASAREAVAGSVPRRPAGAACCTPSATTPRDPMAQSRLASPDHQHLYRHLMAKKRARLLRARSLRPGRLTSEAPS